MATWKKVIVSGSAAELKAVSSSLGIIIDSENAQSSGYMAVSASALSTASFGKLLGDGSQLSNLPETEWDGSRNGNAEISGSLVLTGSAGRIPSLEIAGYNEGVGTQKIGNTSATTFLSGSFDGDFVGSSTGSFNGAIGATRADAGAFTTLSTTGDVTLGNATSDRVTIAGDLIVNGTTTEVRTTNLNIEDKLITLSSGSSTDGVNQVTQTPGIVFAGSRLGKYQFSKDSFTDNTGSALYVDGDSQRLTVTFDGVGSGQSSIVTENEEKRAHIPLVLTGSMLANDARIGKQIGNFKVDTNGEFYVYTA
jgi:hypothetical protein